MGESMSTRLVDAGLDLKVWNRTAERAQALVDEGAVLVDTPLDLAGCDVVFSMLAHGAALHTVMNGDGGLLTGESGPDILIDCSTVSVEDSATLR
jgi:3-hydroxyisobutyrate dehydrogenase